MSQSQVPERHRIAVIGLGEAGATLARGLAASGLCEVAGYDRLLDDATAGPALRAKASSFGISVCTSAAQACQGARIVLSAVPASAALAVAAEAGDFLEAGQLFLDINSVSPKTKRASATAVERSRAAYVEGAVMGPVAPSGLKVPILLAGACAAEVASMLNAAGMNLEVAGQRIGDASAIKMCRSIMIKGIEALTIECFMTARRCGIEDTVIASLNTSFPGVDWEKRGSYMIGRAVQHARRRAAEMREAIATVIEAGLAPTMSAASAQVLEWVADAGLNPVQFKARGEEWRDIIDALSERQRIQQDATAPATASAP